MGKVVCSISARFYYCCCFCCCQSRITSHLESVPSPPSCRNGPDLTWTSLLCSSLLTHLTNQLLRLSAQFLPFVSVVDSLLLHAFRRCPQPPRAPSCSYTNSLRLCWYGRYIFSNPLFAARTRRGAVAGSRSLRFN